MLKNLIVLPDGTEISSGVGTVNAIQKSTLTTNVNSDTELAIGSVCTALLEVKIITPGGGVNIAAGDEITLYQENDVGARKKIGMFTAENPTRASANTYSVTAFDRVSWLDKDLSEWVNNLTGWPYTLSTFATMVCEQCGLTLKTGPVVNADYQIPRFIGEGITGRKLMQWIGELCARFCRATAEGEIEFAWYKKTGVSIATSGSNFYYRNSLSYSDYEVAPIEKVQIHLTEDDVGAVWPTETGEKNTYSITGNYLVSSNTTESLLSVAEAIYEAIKGIRYTPCTVSMPASVEVSAGDIVTITDANGVSISVYAMLKVQAGQRITLSCTGSPRRDSSSVVNNESIKALSGKMLEVKKVVEGLTVKATEVDRKLVETNNSINALEIQTTQKFTELSIASDNLSAKVSHQTTVLDEVQQQVAQAQLTTEGLVLDITKIHTDGVDKITTGMGYTFNDNGVHIQKPGEEMENKLDNTGMYVHRSNEPMLVANNEGVLATDVTIRNFLNMGSYSRFEDYDNGSDSRRTACFAM